MRPLPDEWRDEFARLRAERDATVKKIHAKKGDSLAVDAVIMAIVDAVDVDGALVYDKSGAAS